MTMIIGQIVGGKKLELDLPTLVDTRLLIQANSGGGKSWLLRLIAERAGIQTIVLDNEGEFASVHEAVDVLLVGAANRARWRRRCKKVPFTRARMRGANLVRAEVHDPRLTQRRTEGI